MSTPFPARLRDWRFAALALGLAIAWPLAHAGVDGKPATSLVQRLSLVTGDMEAIVLSPDGTRLTLVSTGPEGPENCYLDCQPVPDAVETAP